MTLAERAILQSILDGDRSFTGMGTAALRQEALEHGMRSSASAMSAGTAATTQIGAGLQPASAVPKADAQQGDPNA